MEGNKLIFGRYTREECGLPPENVGLPNRRIAILRTLCLLAVLLAAGWAAGVVTARWREEWTAALPALVQRAGPDETVALLARGRMYAVALPERPRIARDLAFGALVAAERAPRRMGYYGNVANIFDAMDFGQAGPPAAEFATLLTASGVYAELERYDKAFACLRQADAALDAMPDDLTRRSYHLLLVNAQAYYLAVAPAGEGRNPERALHLAQLLLTSKDELPGGGHASGSAAFLDTLASAWYSAGDSFQAARAQALALGLADSAGLDVYLKHYDEFSEVASK